MQKLAGLITESQYKTKLEEVARTIDLNKPITLSKHLKNIDIAAKNMFPTAQNDQQLVKDMAEKLKSGGLTVGELAKQLNVDENKIQQILLQRKSTTPVFSWMWDLNLDPSNRSANRPT
jgi:hypothetical protein